MEVLYLFYVTVSISEIVWLYVRFGKGLVMNLNAPPRNSLEGMTELQELYRLVGNSVKIRNP
jgi:hypothetical protein